MVLPSTTASTILSPSGAVTICRGEAKPFLLKVEDVCGNAVPLDNAFIVLCVKRCLTDAYPLIVKSSKVVGQIVLGDGEAQIFFLPEDTLNLKAGDYTYDVWVTLPVNQPFCLIPPSLFRIIDRVC